MNTPKILTHPDITDYHISEVTAHYNTNKSVNNVKIISSESAAEYMRSLFPVQIEHREAMLALFLNRANITTGYAVISIGGISGTLSDPKVIFQLALISGCSGFILAHNHPSGNLKPSAADIEITKKIKSGAKLLDISFLDHLILTTDSYYSFADDGAL